MFFYQVGSLELVCSQRIVYTRLCGFALFYWNPTKPFLLPSVVATQSSNIKVVKSLLLRPFRGEKIVKRYFAHPGISFMSLKIKMYEALSWSKNKKSWTNLRRCEQPYFLYFLTPIHAASPTRDECPSVCSATRCRHSLKLEHDGRSNFWSPSYNWKIIDLSNLSPVECNKQERKFPYNLRQGPFTGLVVNFTSFHKLNWKVWVKISLIS